METRVFRKIREIRDGNGKSEITKIRELCFNFKTKVRRLREFTDT